MKDRRIATHLDSIKRMVNLEERLKEKERKKSQSEDNTTIFKVKSGSRTKTIGFENAKSRGIKEIRQKNKEIFKKICLPRKQKATHFKDLWLNYGPQTYSSEFWNIQNNYFETSTPFPFLG